MNIDNSNTYPSFDSNTQQPHDADGNLLPSVPEIKPNETLEEAHVVTVEPGFSVTTVEGVRFTSSVRVNHFVMQAALLLDLSAEASTQQVLDRLKSRMDTLRAVAALLNVESLDDRTAIMKALE